MAYSIEPFQTITSFHFGSKREYIAIEVGAQWAHTYYPVAPDYPYVILCNTQSYVPSYTDIDKGLGFCYLKDATITITQNIGFVYLMFNSTSWAPGFISPSLVTGMPSSPGLQTYDEWAWNGRAEFDDTASGYRQGLYWDTSAGSTYSDPDGKPIPAFAGAPWKAGATAKLKFMGEPYDQSTIGCYGIAVDAFDSGILGARLVNWLGSDGIFWDFLNDTFAQGYRDVATVINEFPINFGSVVLRYGGKTYSVVATAGSPINQSCFLLLRRNPNS